MTTDDRAVDERDAAGRDPGEPDAAGRRSSDSDEDRVERLFGSLPTVRVSRLTDEE